MVESFLAVPLHFTVEFLGFLVLAGAAVLVLSRSSLIPGTAANRGAAALGFAVLAAGQVAHGGSFGHFETDGAGALVVARTAGLALVLIGLLGGLRIAPAAVAAVAAWQIDDPKVVAPGVVALLIAAVAAGGSRGRGPKALRLLALGMVLYAVGQVAGAAAPGAQFGAGVVSVAAYVEHGAEALAYLVFAGWVRSATRASIRTRFVMAFAALLVVVVLALASA
ncbi:MAG TPA: hypothetical protein VFK89_03025, partial [Actinomycetota bacterium]|nr:hypothetical protein [Actinomycetota bacterium]